ncbi:uncharacterized protein SPSK_03812 [Sporothrix schenckii 1099-18]|uniref:Uncharacterized protein n=1 Tax=Sporothrix schenckii 1099-18 TaxID=1397361 RepID=A0A0F2LZ49_SPOSC|nr:uncharacterized protein SPSK_03812 [Sporothrix schenckii 1099-18]KJR82742.1 hypothetical protein SPSK_03812 [Sporothrix schenckii 1099-18]
MVNMLSQHSAIVIVRRRSLGRVMASACDGYRDLHDVAELLCVIVSGPDVLHFSYRSCEAGINTNWRPAGGGGRV